MCDRRKLLLQEKQAGASSNMIDEKIIIADKILKHECMSTNSIKFCYLNV